MTRVISARIDEGVADELDRAARQLGMTKRQFLEEAIRLRAREASVQRAHEILDETAGAWKRDEPADKIIADIRESFERDWRRYQDGPLPT